MQNKIIFGILGLILFVGALLAGYYGPSYVHEQRAKQMREAFVPPGVPQSVTSAFAQQFSDMSAATEPKPFPKSPFTAGDGREWRVADFAGKPTLVNLWATWCPPCVVELPSLQKLAEHYEGRMNVIAISIEPEKSPEEITSFLEKRLLGSFAAYVDTGGTMMQNLGLSGIPTSFLIGSDGQILYRFEGDADWASEDSRAFFDIVLLQKR